MTAPSDLIAAKALALCGTDFHLHGRDPDHGLDCIGLAEICLHAAGRKCVAPNGYAMRGGSLAQIATAMVLAGFGEVAADDLSAESNLQDGDVVLVRPSPVQWHFMIRAKNGFVHAHAGLGAVVFSPGKAAWPITKVFRLSEK